MRYENIRPAVFLARPNRFIAYIEIDGKEAICHVKNTGRCRELLTPGAEIFVEDMWPETGESSLLEMGAGAGPAKAVDSVAGAGPAKAAETAAGIPAKAARKTRYDLIAVQKGGRLINMDAAAPNKVFAEWVRAGGLFSQVDLLKPEQRFGNSRFDFYMEAEGRRAFAEIKGVTLEEEGVVRFPDAPTERGVKHLRELIACRQAGYEAYAVFIIQMKDVFYLEPNWATHFAFGEALRDAGQAGVQLLAIDCHITPHSISAADLVEVRL